jgi:Putative binding domain, N-terminal
MKKKFTYLFSLIILISCSKDLDEVDSNNNSGEEGTNYYFKLRQTQISSSSLETEFEINISTNTNWELQSKPDWVLITPESGSQSAELKITLSENTNPSSRNGQVKFRALDQDYILNISQQSFPLSLVSYSGSESPMKMNENKYLLFNKPITLNSITNGDQYYSFFAGPDNVEYFDNNHGVKFTVGPSNLGSQHKYKFSVSDSDNRTLQQIVDFNFYSQKIIVPGSIKKMILDDDNNLWVLSIKVWSSGEPSYIIKFSENGDSYEEELRFEVGVDYSNVGYQECDFFINPYNSLIYLPDLVDEEIEVYTTSGILVKRIIIDDPTNTGYPKTAPSFIGFNKYGKGIVTVGNMNSSGASFRFIDSSNNDLISFPEINHPYIYEGFNKYVLNFDKSKLYVLENRSPIIKIFDGTESFGEINMNSLYPSGADAAIISQNRLNSKIYVSGLYNQQIITPDFSYLSLQSYVQSFLGDFCYDTNLPNHVYALSSNTDVHLKLLDYDSQNTVLDYPMNNLFNWAFGRGIVTTPNDKYILTYSDFVDNSTSRSQIVIYNTEMFK